MFSAACSRPRQHPLLPERGDGVQVFPYTFVIFFKWRETRALSARTHTHSHSHSQAQLIPAPSGWLLPTPPAGQRGTAQFQHLLHLFPKLTPPVPPAPCRRLRREGGPAPLSLSPPQRRAGSGAGERGAGTRGAAAARGCTATARAERWPCARRRPARACTPPPLPASRMNDSPPDQ